MDGNSSPESNNETLVARARRLSQESANKAEAEKRQNRALYGASGTTKKQDEPVVNPAYERPNYPPSKMQLTGIHEHHGSAQPIIKAKRAVINSDPNSVVYIGGDQAEPANVFALKRIKKVR